MTVAERLPPAGAPVRTGAASFAAAMIAKAAGSPREPVTVIFDSPKSRLGVLLAPQADDAPDSIDATVTAVLPALYPEWLGDRSFCETHGVRFPYVVGEMANGLTTTRMVVEAARAGFLGFFGAAGLDPARIEDAVAQLSRELGPDISWGSNLIHSPQESALEDATVEVYLRRGVRRVSASAFMRLTLPVVRYAASGLTADAGGRRAAAAPPLRQDLASRDGAVLPRPGPAGDARRAGRGRETHAGGGRPRPARAAGRGHNGRSRFRRAHGQPAPVGDLPEHRPRGRRPRRPARPRPPGAPRRRRRARHPLRGRRGVRARARPTCSRDR